MHLSKNTSPLLDKPLLQEPVAYKLCSCGGSFLVLCFLAALNFGAFLSQLLGSHSGQERQQSVLQGPAIELASAQDEELMTPAAALQKQHDKLIGEALRGQRSTLRVGFLSTANICRKNSLAIKAAVGVELVAVSSRNLEKAQAWAKQWGVPKFYGSHEELLADKDVDAVYVPLPTGVRVPIVIAAAQAGKHVMCEKPIAPTAEEASKMITACRENGVVFMDGTMFMHNPRLDAMYSVMKSNDFGEIKRVNSDFSFFGGEEFHTSNIRGGVHGPALEPLGSLGDLGWYNARLSMFAFDWALPLSASAVAHTIKDGMPVDLSCVLTFGEGKSSTWTNSYNAAFRQHAAIVGTKQAIELTDFCLSGHHLGGANSTACSFRIYKRAGLNQYDLLPENDVVDEDVHYTANQEVRMWEKFADLCRNRDDVFYEQEIQFYADVSLNTQRILDALMASLAKGGAVQMLSPPTISLQNDQNVTKASRTWYDLLMAWSPWR